MSSSHSIATPISIAVPGVGTASLGWVVDGLTALICAAIVFIVVFRRFPYAKILQNPASPSSFLAIIQIASQQKIFFWRSVSALFVAMPVVAIYLAMREVFPAVRTSIIDIFASFISIPASDERVKSTLIEALNRVPVEYSGPLVLLVLGWLLRDRLSSFLDRLVVACVLFADLHATADELSFAVARDFRTSQKISLNELCSRMPLPDAFSVPQELLDDLAKTAFVILVSAGRDVKSQGIYDAVIATKARATGSVSSADMSEIAFGSSPRLASLLIFCLAVAVYIFSAPSAGVWFAIDDCPGGPPQGKLECWKFANGFLWLTGNRIYWPHPQVPRNVSTFTLSTFQFACLFAVALPVLGNKYFAKFVLNKNSISDYATEIRVLFAVQACVSLVICMFFALAKYGLVKLGFFPQEDVGVFDPSARRFWTELCLLALLPALFFAAWYQVRQLIYGAVNHRGFWIASLGYCGIVVFFSVLGGVLLAVYTLIYEFTVRSPTSAILLGFATGSTLCALLVISGVLKTGLGSARRKFSVESVATASASPPHATPDPPDPHDLPSASKDISLPVSA